MPAAAMLKGFLSLPQLKKTGGQTSTGPALSTTYVLPMQAANPRNPANLVYPPLLNAAGAPTIKVASKKTPSVELGPIPLKSSFWSAVFLNSLIGGSTSYLDTNFNQDEYAIGLGDGSTIDAIYDGGKCTQITLYQTAPGGPIQMSQSWLCQYGDSEKGSPTSFSNPSIDPGSAYDVTNTAFTGATDVMSWTLTLQRAVGYAMYCDGTLYSDTLQSGMIGGVLTLVQNANAVTVPSTTVTIVVGGVTIVLSLSKDQRVKDRTPSLLPQTTVYTLIKSDGTYPVVIS